MKIKYEIKILCDWHCGSGLDSGTDADSLVLKDEIGLPYIPGKTIKGLLKESLQEISYMKGKVLKSISFGYDNKEAGVNEVYTNTLEGESFFSNAFMDDIEKDEILNNKLEDFLYRNIASTANESNGIAKDKSLRKMEVCMPLSLKGHIDNVNEGEVNDILMAMKWTRRLGVNRNRGLGRCIFSSID